MVHWRHYNWVDNPHRPLEVMHMATLQLANYRVGNPERLLDVLQLHDQWVAANSKLPHDRRHDSAVWVANPGHQAGLEARVLEQRRRVAKGFVDIGTAAGIEIDPRLPSTLQDRLLR